MKTTLFKVHKWLALCLSLPFIILAFTGIVMTLETKAPAQNQMIFAPVPLEVILSNVQKLYPKASITRVNFNDQSAMVYVKDDVLRHVTVGRLDGKIMKDIEAMSNPFYAAKMIHESLLLSKPGKVIIALCGLGLFIVLLSGFFYWWGRKFQFNFKRLKDIHILVGLLFIIPLGFASSMAFLIELNTLFWSDKPLLPHTAPVSCTFEDQLSLIGKMELAGGRINFCRKDYPYLTYITKQGSQDFTPEGEIVLNVSKSDWQDTFYFRKHHFVHLHSGDEFGSFKTPYRLLIGFSLLTLTFSGFFMWRKK